MRRAIRSRRAVTPEGIRPATIVFENGLIAGVEGPGFETGAMPILDVQDLYLLPGLVDSHIHVNEPGRTEWEGFGTASRAAAAGGYTCLVDMPLNCIPATTNVPALEAKREAAACSSVVDYAFWGGAVKGNVDDLKPLAKAGVRGFKSFLVDSGIEEFSCMGEHDLRSAMPVIAQTGLPLLVHAEDANLIAEAYRGITGDQRQYATYLRSRPAEAEVAAIDRMIGLCREYGCRVHIVHLSAAAALPSLKRARYEGLPITTETCPHYLYFDATQIRDGATEFKCAPPIRGEADRECLWKALEEGVIDLIATDHSPCPPEMKRLQDGDFLRAWGGIAAVSLALPVIWTAASQRGFTMAKVARWMAEKPAQLAGLSSRKGRLATGYDADFVAFDPDARVIVRSTDLYFRHPLSPYVGERLRGQVMKTFVRGTPVFDAGSFDCQGRGRECTVNQWSTA